MTYTINIGGSGTHSSDEEHQQFEDELQAKAREFVGTLEGVNTATITGNKIGTVNLKEAQS